MSTDETPRLLTGTETTLVAEVPGAGGRWSQVHFNINVTRRFFGLTVGSTRSVTLERIRPSGKIMGRIASRLVFSERNRNAKIEFDFHPLPTYPGPETRPIIVVVDTGNSTYRYRLVMPSDNGYVEMTELLAAGPSEGKGVPRRIVSLDEVEAYWPGVALRGGI